MQQQVERVQVVQTGLGDFFGQGFEENALALQLLDQRRIAPRVLEYRVDQYRRACGAITQQVAVGAGLRVEQLAKDQHRSVP